MLNTPQTVTINAFLTALLKLDSPLPAKLQQEINQVGQIFADTPTDAINRLLELAKDDVLKEFYLQARMNIQQQYEIQERNKHRDLKKESQTNATDPEMIENLAIAMPSKSIEAILKAADSPAEAKKYAVEIKLVIQ
ncbi:hypothetical protein Cylst_0742 [Cylindrospermum stagnale PCC 7417]|uniref:Uncharacterized protein n=1 Tax=Cylindrospermum stagnale PCC 7417 TaxID=56107 RepID=K9WTG5_9NOST|nr:hypothetical protein [Cylindrospermum stagnale]AFZ23069.1 hypothetical protein Cylst_0742 [Cylindrospermum stagnale PCC 7417]